MQSGDGAGREDQAVNRGRQDVWTWLNEAVAASSCVGVSFPVPVTPHTSRHSYAMHMLYADIALKAMQSLMGHRSIKSTEVYTRVFALDMAARHRVQFQMPGTEAVAMLWLVGINDYHCI